MTKFALIYTGGKPPSSKEEGMAHMQRWQAWAKGLGDAYIYPGMPFSSASTVSSDGTRPGSDGPRLSGISIVEADTLADAQAMASACPHLDLGGEIIVAEGMDLPM